MSKVVNRTGGIETRDGRTLYGLDAETYLKMASKEDPEMEKTVIKWIESVLDIKIRMFLIRIVGGYLYINYCHFLKIASYDVGNELKSGIILCRFVLHHLHSSLII